MDLASGFLLVLVAGVLQGTFVLPMTLTRGWAWEHTWAAFSFFGMLLFNGALALVTLGDLPAIYAAVPAHDLMTLGVFGAGWGVGAVLFGVGMDRLGMALGYPIIMGLIASMGALVPLLVFYPGDVLQLQGLILVSGTALVMVGIVLSAKAGSLRTSENATGALPDRRAFRGAIMIAIAAGLLSCLPNVGISFGARMEDAAVAAGVSPVFAGNAVWGLFFALGFLVNAAWCLFLMVRKGSIGAFAGPEAGRNILLGAAMGAMWIGSFYAYGMGAAHLGAWGAILGWPIFIALSIVVGNLWGLWRGEWKEASARPRALLNRSLLVMTIAVVVIAISKFYSL